MRVLVGCEFSGIVRDAFIARGHDAWSCDLSPSEVPGPHIQGDLLDYLDSGWDLMIAHPPCTHLATSGAKWFSNKPEAQLQALRFVRILWAASIPRIALENPVGVLSYRLARPTQIIQPWQFGHYERKQTCLWLKNLPKLQPTKIVDGWNSKILQQPAGPNQWKERSRFYSGIANAMADQWGA